MRGVVFYLFFFIIIILIVASYLLIIIGVSWEQHLFTTSSTTVLYFGSYDGIVAQVFKRLTLNGSAHFLESGLEGRSRSSIFICRRGHRLRRRCRVLLARRGVRAVILAIDMQVLLMIRI